MQEQPDRAVQRWGLLAKGSSQRWDVDVNESHDGEEWELEIDGPHAYLRFQVRDLNAVVSALHFLQCEGHPGRALGPGEAQDEEGALALGWFGGAPVSLLWDNEDFPRCFLVVAPETGGSLRLSLDAEDVRMLVRALRDVVDDLPHADRP